MKGLQRFISGMLAVCLLISMLPASAWATETEPVVETVLETTVWETQETVEMTESTMPPVVEIAPEATTAEIEVPELENTETIDTDSDEIAIPSAFATIVASGTCGENLTWTLDDAGTLEISGQGNMAAWGSAGASWYECDEKIKNVIINSGVTSIGDHAFASCRKMKAITIPESVTKIASYAFEDCDNLESVALPNGVTTIGAYAFHSCDSLTTINIPGSVTNIEYLSFADCLELITVSIGDGVTSIGEKAFSGCKSLKSIDLPRSVTCIDTHAFSQCTGLTSVYLQEGITTIGYGAFQNCSSLEAIHIPGSISCVDTFAFSGCTSLKTVSIAAGATSIDDSAFSHCTSLMEITVDDSNTMYSDVDGVLFSADKTTLHKYPAGRSGNYMIPDGVTRIGAYSFESCSNLTGIAIPDGVTSIGPRAFYNCTSLTSVIIPTGVMTIGVEAFYSCKNLTNITIPDSVTGIGDEAFAFCTNLDNVVIPGNVNYLGLGVFISCSSLTNFSIPNGVTELNAQCFDQCENLASVTIPAGVSAINMWTFRGCSALRSITIPDGVISIDDEAFKGCVSLGYAILPNSISSMGSDIFAYCPELTDIYFSGSEEQWSIIGGISNNDFTNIKIHYNSVGPDDYDLTGWRKAYYDYVSTNPKPNNYSPMYFEPIYLDNDPIPELWIYYGGALGCTLLTYKEDTFFEYDLASGMLMYAQSNNLFCHSGGTSGTGEWDTVYTLKKGILTEVASGEHVSGKFTWNGQEVSEAEYYASRDQYLDPEITKTAGSNSKETYDYDGILEWLLNPEIYQLVCTPEEPVVQTGQQLELVVSLYCNDQLVNDWEPVGYSVVNLKYKDANMADDGYHLILEADKIGDAHVTVKYTSDVSLHIPVTVVSDVEEDDFLRKEWIQEHIDYAAGEAYAKEIVAGYYGRMNPVFQDVIEDEGIQFYDFTDCVVNFGVTPSQADMYGVILANVLMTSLNEDFMYEAYVNNLNTAMVDFALAVSVGIASAADIPKDVVDAIQNAAEVLKNTDPKTTAFVEARNDFISIAKKNFDIDKFTKSAVKGGLLTLAGIILDGIDIDASTHEEIYIYACHSMAYQATSEDFMRVLESMEQKIYREFAAGDFPGIGKYDDEMNWNDLASAVSGFRKEIEKNKLDHAKAVADYAVKTESEADDLFAKRTLNSIIKYAGTLLLNCVPGLSLIPNAYAILEAGKLAIEIFTTADDRAYCLDMLTKLYCLSVLLDSTADEFAAGMTEDKFWISAAFDETITMYKATQKLAAEYMILYTDHMISKTYQDLNLAIASKNPVAIALKLAKFEETIAWYDNSKLQLSEQKTEIENILCHSPFLHYNSVTNEIHGTYLDSNIYIIACPTAVQVLDETGKQIAYLSNDTCQVEDGHELYYRTIPLSDTESMKIAVVPDSYKMVVSGTAEGEMDVFAAEFKEDIDTVSTYLNVPINVDSEIILEPDKDNPEVIHLTVDDTPCEPFTVTTIAQGTCGDNLSWALYEEGVLSITGSGEMYDFRMGESPWTEYRKQITEILLPDGLTRIGNEAFRGLHKVQSVAIPEGVTEIGSCAFIMSGLTSVSLPESLRIIDSGAFSDTPLKAVDIPDSVTHIGNGAFSECDYVDHIFIPASVTTIGSGPFSNCRNLTSISVDPGNPNFITDANGVLYNSEMTTLYQCPGAFSGEYIIPDGVTKLGSCAFEGCAGLTKVTIPDSVTSLPGQSTFAYCTGLTELILPDGITALNYGFAFRVSSLTNIRLPKQLAVLDDAAFYDCSSLTRIIIPESVTEIGSRCFENTALNSVIFRGSAPSINETAFTGVTATAYYPGNDPSWTADTMLNYGGSLTWVPVYENETVTHIDAKKTILNAGETLDLTAVLDPGVLVDEEIIWTLYDDGNGGGTELMTENGTTAQLYAGYYLYDNVITVTAQAADSSAEPAVLEITIRERDADYTLFAGKSLTLKETDPATGKPYASKRLQWYMSSENEPYATLTSAGKLTAKKVVSKNRIIVYADIDGKPGFMRVVDIYPAVTQVDVMWEDNNPINGKTIPVDFTTQNLLFTVTAHPLDTMQNVTWSISDSEKQTYAEYETNGRVLRVFNLKRTKAGTVTVKATVNAGQKKSVSFKLQFGSFAKEVNISAAADYLQSGNSLQLSAATVPAKPTKSGITWSLSKEDKAYASISSSGLLKAKTVYGRTKITVIATSKDGHAQAEFPVTILPANSAILLLKCGEENVTKRTVYVDLNGDPTITLTAERFDKLAQPSVTWTVPKSAEVLEKTDTSLTLRFLKAGTATITATGADKQKATVKVVAAKMAQSVEISQKKTNLTEGFEVASGKTLELKATVENAKNKKVTWSLAPGDKDFAKISSSGKLTASKNLTTMRQVTVTATAADGSGISDVAVVTIRPIAQGVQIYSVVDGVRTFSVRSNPSRWVRSNTVYEWDMVASTRLTLSSHVYPYYTEDHPRNAMQGVTWKSSSTKVASVDANGNVICHKPGSATITATAKDGSGKKVTFKLTVVKKTTGLQLPDQQVIGGKTLALNKLVQYSPTDVTNKTLKWEIIGGTGTAYATLSSKGSLKTKKVTKPVTVTVRITATDGTPYTDTCTVTILPKS